MKKTSFITLTPVSLLYYFFLQSLTDVYMCKWRHDTQHNDIQQDDTQHNNNVLSVIMLIVAFIYCVEYRYAYAECRGAVYISCELCVCVCARARACVRKYVRLCV